MSKPIVSDRIRTLLAEMTLEEKLGQLTMIDALAGGASSRSPVEDVRAGRVGSLLNLWGAQHTRKMQHIAVAESRLGIPLLFSFDVLHGQRTIFPIPLAEAGTFAPDLWQQTAEIAAAEAIEDGLHLTFAPMLDISRDPRWGRIAESPGEDTYVACCFARAKVRGFQSTPGFLACAKHAVGYGAVLAGREYASTDMSERLLHEVYLPPFRAAVEAGVAAIMPALTELNGVPMVANKALLRDLIREQWGFSGVIISDYQSISELVTRGFAVDIGEAAALALEASVDIDMTSGAYNAGLPIALRRGRIGITDIDAAVLRVLALKERLGLFDIATTSTAPTSRAPLRRDLAREAARRSTVLLTHRAAILPLADRGQTIALLGPLADATDNMLGPQWAAGEAGDVISIRAGLGAALPNSSILHAIGAPFAGEDATALAQALDLARRADLIVLCLGESRDMSGEAGSRGHPELPDAQVRLALACIDLGKPCVVLFSSGRPLVLPARLVETAAAMLATWFLGSEAGSAIADILTGSFNPTGRLAISWPSDIGQIPVFYGERPTGRPADPAVKTTSKYLDIPNQPLFAFGEGLSYTRFAFTALESDRNELHADETASLSIEVTNIGSLAGETDVLAFVRGPAGGFSRPALQLCATAKIALAAGEKRRLTLPLAAAALVSLDADLAPRLVGGTYTIFVGPDAREGSLLGTTLRLVAP